MTEDKPIIEPERAGLWAAAAFVLALVAFVMAFVGIYQSREFLAGTEAQILALNQKIEDLRKGGAPAAAPAPAPAAPVADRPAAK